MSKLVQVIQTQSFPKGKEDNAQQSKIIEYVVNEIIDQIKTNFYNTQNSVFKIFLKEYDEYFQEQVEQNNNWRIFQMIKGLSLLLQNEVFYLLIINDKSSLPFTQQWLFQGSLKKPNLILNVSQQDEDALKLVQQKSKITNPLLKYIGSIFKQHWIYKLGERQYIEEYIEIAQKLISNNLTELEEFDIETIQQFKKLKQVYKAKEIYQASRFALIQNFNKENFEQFQIEFLELQNLVIQENKEDSDQFKFIKCLEIFIKTYEQDQNEEQFKQKLIENQDYLQQDIDYQGQIKQNTIKLSVNQAAEQNQEEQDKIPLVESVKSISLQPAFYQSVNSMLPQQADESVKNLQSDNKLYINQQQMTFQNQQAKQIDVSFNSHFINSSKLDFINSKVNKQNNIKFDRTIQSQKSSGKIIKKEKDEAYQGQLSQYQILIQNKDREIKDMSQKIKDLEEQVERLKNRQFLQQQQTTLDQQIKKLNDQLQKERIYSQQMEYQNKHKVYDMQSQIDKLKVENTDMKCQLKEYNVSKSKLKSIPKIFDDPPGQLIQKDNQLFKVYYQNKLEFQKSCLFKKATINITEEFSIKTISEMSEDNHIKLILYFIKRSKKNKNGEVDDYVSSFNLSYYDVTDDVCLYLRPETLKSCFIAQQKQAMLFSFCEFPYTLPYFSLKYEMNQQQKYTLPLTFNNFFECLEVQEQRFKKVFQDNKEYLLYTENFEYQPILAQEDNLRLCFEKQIELGNNKKGIILENQLNPQYIFLLVLEINEKMQIKIVPKNVFLEQEKQINYMQYLLLTLQMLFEQ